MTIAGNNTFVKILNIILPLIGAALMIVYEFCITSCSSIKGAFLGVDLKWVGIIYMAILFASTFTVQGVFREKIIYFRTILISMAVGVEFYLIGFQVLKDVYCPFCLAFGTCIFILFGINYTSMNKKIMVTSAAVALIGFTLCFEGQVTLRFDLS
ncbi:MAG: hypothetical protein NTX75_00900 [Proteobacteria bacterium]|nr:hypothetical protein [Pseudomonadota bacterium]